MQQFKVGDVVQLKSGSPLMTVSEIEESNKFFCVWFSGDERKGGSFNAQVLKIYEEEK